MIIVRIIAIITTVLFSERFYMLYMPSTNTKM